MKNRRRITRFGLIRHAKTRWNREKRIQGQYDTPLTSEAERQIRRWRYRLKNIRWDRVLTSDIGRARKTAEHLNASFNVSMVEEAGLREQDWGKWTGKTLRQIRQETPHELTVQENAGWHFRPPGGEDRRCVWQRSRRALVRAAECWPGENILVVTHEGVIKSLIYRLSNRRFLPEEPRLLDAYCLHWLQCDAGRLGVDRINALALEQGAGS